MAPVEAATSKLDQPTRLMVRPSGPLDATTRQIAIPRELRATPEPPVARQVTAVPAATPDPVPSAGACQVPGSAGERLLQRVYGTEGRAARFYNEQLLDHLNPTMIEFVGRMELAFVATSDSAGHCDSTLRAGPAGFIQVLDRGRIAYPEYRGNGVMASLGNISENPHIGMLMIDFAQDVIGLHVNGRASIVEDAELRLEHPALPSDFERGRTPERWVVVQVVEAYVHCRKHIPRLVPVARHRAWGTDDAKRKGGDFFDAKAVAKPWQQPPAVAEPLPVRAAVAWPGSAE